MNIFITASCIRDFTRTERIGCRFFMSIQAKTRVGKF